MIASRQGLDWLLETYEPPFKRWHYKEAAEKFGGASSAVEKMLGLHRRRPDLLEKVCAGELGLFHASKEAGFLDTMFRNPKGMSANGPVFGKGDRFWDSASPLARYLKAWQKRGYEFTHVPPKEAKRRLNNIDNLIEMLTAAREDLAVRSELQKLTVNREGK